MRIVFDKNGWDDHSSWLSQDEDPQRINRLINEAARDPGFGAGKPERLTGNLSGYWSPPDHRRTSAGLYRER